MATNTPNLQLRKPDFDPVTGDSVDVALDLNANWDILDTAVQDALDGLSTTRPIAQLRNTTVTSIPNNATTAVVFQTEDFDTHNGHDAGVNPSRWTCPVGQGGVYRVGYTVGWTARASTGTGDVRVAAIHKNGTELPGSVDQIRALDQLSTQPFNKHSPILVTLAPGDFLDVRVTQTSGTALDTYVGTPGGQTIFTIEWVRP